MIYRASLFVFLALSFSHISNSTASETYPGDGLPVKFIQSCQMDFDRNGSMDIALLMQSSSGLELIVLMRDNDGFQAHKPHQGKSQPTILQLTVSLDHFLSVKNNVCPS